MDHAMKFSSYVHLPSMNKIFRYRYAYVILRNVGKVIIFKHGWYISAWNILGCKYLAGAWVIK